MGYSVSWIGFHGLPKSEVLGRTSLRETGVPDEANETPFSLAELPFGWIILFSNDLNFGAAEHLRALSANTTLVSCQVEEHIMFSAAYCWVSGEQVWCVRHDGEKGVYDLTVSGRPPNALDKIKEQLESEQDSHGGASAAVDFGFDVPVQLAATITQYRHDRWKFPWGEPRFHALNPMQ